MTKHIKIIIVILILLLLIIILSPHNEHYTGALMQLYSKGPQDEYLTNSDHLYPYFYNNYNYNPLYPYNGTGYNYPRYFWNQPTRFRRNSAPYLLLTPDSNYLY